MRNIRESRRKERVIEPFVGLANLSESNIQKILKEEILGPSKIRPKGWNFQPAVIEAHRQFFELTKGQKYVYPKTRFSGRGIVTLAGGKYFTCGYILVRLLRELGCTLPIEWWYLDDSEVDFEMQEIIKSLGATPRCAEDVIEEIPRCFGGWQAKIWSIIYSQFEEVLFLDSDQLPVKDPEFLFDAEEYTTAGAVFWQDYRNHLGMDITRESFEVLGIPVPENTREPRNHPKPTNYDPFESGQILLNKSKQWDTIQLCKLLNDHSDFFYPDPRGRQQWHIYGDKSTFCLAWMHDSVFVSDNYFIMPSPYWGGVKGNGAFMQPDFLGNTIFQHKCQPPEKYRYGKKYPHAPGLLHQEKVDKYITELSKVWNGKIWPNVIPDNSCSGVYKDENNNVVELLANGKLSDGGNWGFYDEYLVLKPSKNRSRLYGKGRDGVFVRSLKNGQSRYLIPDNTTKFIIPPGDKFAAGAYASVVHANEYCLPNKLPRDAEIVDIGAHIGSFSVACLERGAKRVIAFEPDPANYEYVYKNLLSYKNQAEFYNLGVCGNNMELQKFGFGYPVGAKHSGGGSITDIQKSEIAKYVPVCGWQQIRKLLPDSIFLLKLDCEGAEWSILINCNLSNVENICGEYHLAHNNFDTISLRELLTVKGFQFHIKENLKDLGLFFAWKKQNPFVFA